MTHPSMGGAIMVDFVGHSANEMGQANTAILGSLLDHLLARNILTPPEVVSVLDAAYTELDKNSHIISVHDGMQIVSKLQAVYKNIEPS
jgi:hypothetical protein